MYVTTFRLPNGPPLYTRHLPYSLTTKRMYREVQEHLQVSKLHPWQQQQQCCLLLIFFSVLGGSSSWCRWWRVVCIVSVGSRGLPWFSTDGPNSVWALHIDFWKGHTWTIKKYYWKSGISTLANSHSWHRVWLYAGFRICFLLLCRRA